MNNEDYLKLDIIKIKYKDKYNKTIDTILSDNSKNEKYDKLRLLNLISVYQKVLKSTFPKNEKIYVLDKTFLDQYYYNEINDLLNSVQNININDFKQNNDIEITLDELNFNKLKLIGKAICSKKEEYKNSEEIILAQNKKANIYKELILIDSAQFKIFKQIFEINIKEIEFLVINNKDILIIKDNENALNMIIIGNLDKNTSVYNPTYLLEYNDINTLESHLNSLKNKGIDNYINEYIPLINNEISCFIKDKKDKFGIAYKYDKNRKNYFLPHINCNYDSCPNIGLQNIGATCYMNSTLQCFCHIDKFVDYFKYSSKLNGKEKDKYRLTLSFKELIDNLWPDKIDPSKKSYAPNEFKKTISEMNPLFQGNNANDAKDLVNFIIMTLYLELSGDANNQFGGVTEVGNTTKILNDKLIAKTIVGEIFYGINFTESKCTICNTKQINYQSFFFLIFPLEEVRKNKEKSNVPQPIQNNLNQSLNLNKPNSQGMIGQMSQSLNLGNMNNSQPMLGQMNQQQQFYNNNQMVYNNQPGFIPRVMSSNMNNMSMNNFMNNNQFMMQQQVPYPNNFNSFQMSMNMPINNNNNMMPFQSVNNNYMAPGQQPQPQQNQNNKNEVSIDECFEYYIKENTMDGDNSMYCQKCKCNQTFMMATKIKKFPEVLIIILNRGVGLEFDVKISFGKMINLKKYTQSSEDKKEENSEDVTQYDVIGVISHLGESGEEGHFIAYCRDPIKREKWFKYNDAFVDEVKDFTKEVVAFGMPYVLFYQKHNTNSK